MRSYEIYRNIRKGALIWGLPLSFFALLMVSVVASLLVIIFSFSLILVVGLFFWNGCLFIGLNKVNGKTHLLNITRVFPKSISNKKHNILNHVEDQYL